VIVCAAIKTGDGRVWALMPPARHADIIGKIVQETRRAVRGDAQQGFLACSVCNIRKLPGAEAGITTLCHAEPHGQFVSRPTAEHLAREAGQLSKPLLGSVLTSEDLW
jgi:hypothetical protein